MLVFWDFVTALPATGGAMSTRSSSALHIIYNLTNAFIDYTCAVLVCMVLFAL
jgi:hypothetical protein